jgi:hypothetical protein
MHRVRIEDMTSSRGFWAAITFLAALPVALLCQVVFGIDAEMVLHLVCALGFTLIAWSAFDFRTPRWVRWLGCVSSGALAVIYLLQGLSQLAHNESLTYLAFPVLGQWPERVLTDLLILWFAAVVLMDSQGKTKIVGIICMSITVLLEICTYGMSFLGASLYAAAPLLKILILLPFVWLLLESRRSTSQEGFLHTPTT